MLNKTKIALVATLVFGSLSAARAEDPEADVLRRLHTRQVEVDRSQRLVPISQSDRRRLKYQALKFAPPAI